MKKILAELKKNFSLLVLFFAAITLLFGFIDLFIVVLRLIRASGLVVASIPISSSPIEEVGHYLFYLWFGGPIYLVIFNFLSLGFALVWLYCNKKYCRKKCLTFRIKFTKNMVTFFEEENIYSK